MNTPVKACCNNCVYFLVDPREKNENPGGNCRRFPPRSFPLTRQSYLDRTKTEITTAIVACAVQGLDWCGEHWPISCGAPDCCPVAGPGEDREV